MNDYGKDVMRAVRLSVKKRTEHGFKICSIPEDVKLKKGSENHILFNDEDLFCLEEPAIGRFHTHPAEYVFRDVKKPQVKADIAKYAHFPSRVDVVGAEFPIKVPNICIASAKKTGGDKLLCFNVNNNLVLHAIEHFQDMKYYYNKNPNDENRNNFINAAENFLKLQGVCELKLTVGDSKYT